MPFRGWCAWTAHYLTICFTRVGECPFTGQHDLPSSLGVEVEAISCSRIGCCRVGRLVQPRPEMEPQRKCDVVQRVDDSAGLAQVQKPSNRGLSEEKLVYLPPKGFFNRSCRFFDLKKKLWGVPVEAKILSPRADAIKVVLHVSFYKKKF